eukprot:6311034-Ditylum_brightwellii.AAC.1
MSAASEFISGGIDELGDTVLPMGSVDSLEEKEEVAEEEVTDAATDFFSEETMPTISDDFVESADSLEEKEGVTEEEVTDAATDFFSEEAMPTVSDDFALSLEDDEILEKKKSTIIDADIIDAVRNLPSKDIIKPDDDFVPTLEIDDILEEEKDIIEDNALKSTPADAPADSNAMSEEVPLAPSDDISIEEPTVAQTDDS